MKRFFAIVVVGVFLFGLIGCGSTAEKKSNSQDLDFPVWFLKVPVEDDAIYAAAYSKRKLLPQALDSAGARAQAQISRVIGNKVATMTKDFLEEAGTSDQSVATEYTSTVTKMVSDNAMSGCKEVERSLKKGSNASGEEYYEAFVLYKLSLKDMSSKIDEIMRQNSANYAKLQAKKGFDELAAELKAMNGNDNQLAGKPGTID